MSEWYLPVAGRVNPQKYLYQLLWTGSADVTPLLPMPASILRRQELMLNTAEGKPTVLY